MSSVPAISTESAAWLCGLLQAGDSYYPTGAYAHSFGLEGLVQVGVVKDAATLRDFAIASVLPALRQLDLPLAAHAWRALDPAHTDWDQVGELCTLSHVLKSAREPRHASDNIGRQRAELLVKLHAHPLAIEYQRRVIAGGWPHSAPVSAALEGRVHGAPLVAVLTGLTYASLSGQIAAAMKLIRLGQNAAQSLLTELLARAPDAIAHAAEVPLEEIGWFNPWLDVACARHETSDFRLFIS
ncbi:MAG: urease accessory UreF family protein [Verrucomicrobiota bacterium]